MSYGIAAAAAVLSGQPGWALALAPEDLFAFGARNEHTHAFPEQDASGGGGGGGGDGGTRTLFNDFFVHFFEIFHGRASVLFTGILPLRKHTIKTNKNKASLSKSAGLGRGKKT